MRRLDRVAGHAGIGGSAATEVCAMAKLARHKAPTGSALSHFRHGAVVPWYCPTGDRLVMAISGHAGRNAAASPRHGHFMAFLAPIECVRSQGLTWMNGDPIRRVELAILAWPPSPGLVPAAASQSCPNHQQDSSKGSQMKES